MRLIDADWLLSFICLDEKVIAPERHTAQDIIMMIQTAPTIEPPPNDPLTLEELREMDGEPVWVTRLDCWKVCYGLSEFRGYLCMETGDGSCINMESYGKWLVYRRKPEEGKYGTD